MNQIGIGKLSRFYACGAHKALGEAGLNQQTIQERQEKMDAEQWLKENARFISLSQPYDAWIDKGDIIVPESTYGTKVICLIIYEGSLAFTEYDFTEIAGFQQVPMEKALDEILRMLKIYEDSIDDSFDAAFVARIAREMRPVAV